MQGGAWKNEFSYGQDGETGDVVHDTFVRVTYYSPSNVSMLTGAAFANSPMIRLNNGELAYHCSISVTGNTSRNAQEPIPHDDVMTLTLSPIAPITGSVMEGSIPHNYVVRQILWDITNADDYETRPDQVTGEPAVGSVSYSAYIQDMLNIVNGDHEVLWLDCSRLTWTQTQEGTLPTQSTPAGTWPISVVAEGTDLPSTDAQSTIRGMFGYFMPLASTRNATIEPNGWLDDRTPDSRYSITFVFDGATGLLNEVNLIDLMPGRRDSGWGPGFGEGFGNDI